MKWWGAPCLVTLMGEINARWPERDKSSDGMVGDARHAREHSDHNPDPSSSPPGVVRAVDIDVDLDGVARNSAPDVSLVVHCLLLHPATHYIIYNKVIWDRDYQFRPRDYLAVNPHGDPHTSHIHISILHGEEHNTTPWLAQLNIPEVDDMPWTKEQLTEIMQDAVRSTPFTNKDGKTYALQDIIASMDANILNIPNALLSSTVHTIDPSTGQDAEVHVSQALGRGAEATVIRQSEGITDGKSEPGIVTGMIDAIKAEIGSGNDEAQQALNELGKRLGARRGGKPSTTGS